METGEFKFGKNGDEFKPFGEVLLSDVRQTFWVKIQPDGSTRPFQFDDLHKRMAVLVLNSTAPEDVRTGFDTARNLYLYSWFVYRFLTVAELQVYAAFEYALGKRIEIENVGRIHGLNKRFDFAVGKGWLQAEGIRRFQMSAKRRGKYAEEQERLYKKYLKPIGGWQNLDSKTEAEHASEYLHHLKIGIPKLRNSIAHGEPMLDGGTVLTIEICCDLINQLFPEKPTG
ncbi:MAG TPA: hypothetical protein VGI63_09285 [Verrucomicrobiae bacterium]|jgi:hypothetical protein